MRPDDADKVTDGNPCISAPIRVQFSSDQYPEICSRYEAALRASDAVDFDDLILLPIRLLEEHPDVLAATQARYRWISVDEYQDVNAAQYRLLRLLTATGSDNLPRRHGEHGDDSINLCVIGDPDQAIYGFRGADRRYFLQFEQDYPGAVTLSLSRNYRSSQRILDAASQVIARNPDRKSVEILAEFADEVKLDVYRAPTDKAEAEYVVHQIEQMVGGISHFSLDSGRTDGAVPAAARSFADFAVLYRLLRPEPSPDRGIRPLRHPVPDDRAGAADQPQGGARGAGAPVAAVQSTVASACSAIRWIVRYAIQRIALQSLTGTGTSTASRCAGCAFDRADRGADRRAPAQTL